MGSNRYSASSSPTGTFTNTAAFRVGRGRTSASGVCSAMLFDASMMVSMNGSTASDDSVRSRL